MEIRRDNYEQYFIDYLDGNLSPGEVKILLSFLEFNSDLREELEGMEMAYCDAPEVNFPGKKQLKKMLSPFEEQCIASVENELNPEQETRLKEILASDTEKKRLYGLYQSTKLVPDTRILFKGKHRIKKPVFRWTRARILIPATTAAAILVFALILFERKGSNTIPEGIVQKEEIQQDNSFAEEMSNETDSEIRAEINPELPVISLVKTESLQISGSSEKEKKDEISLNTRDGYLEPLEPIRADKIIANSGSAIIENRQLLKGIDYYDRESLLAYAGEQASLKKGTQRATGALWKIADVGVRALDDIAEGDYKLNRTTSESGRTRKLVFETPLFGVSTPIRNTGGLQ